jgi:nitrite reductase (NADH) small subunit
VTGEAVAPDQGCVPTIPVRVVAGRILIARASAIQKAA